MAGIITLSIIGAIAALILLILFLKASLTVGYTEAGATLTLKVLFIEKRLYPKEEKKRRKRGMSANKAKRIKDKLNSKKEKKKQKKADKKSAKEKKKTSVSDILNIVQTVCVIVKELVLKFAKHLRIKIVKINIKVATGDAAQTAIAYGAVTQSINVLFPLLEDIKNFSMPKNENINIFCDFLSEDSEMELKLTFSIRVWQVLSTALAILCKIIIHYIKSLERKERKNHGK